jgi:hypothetical protein
MRIADFVNVRLAVASISVACCGIAYADTVLDFGSLPDGQANGAMVISGFGSFASTSSPGVTVTGFGTPDIGLTWGQTPNGSNPIQWNYYSGGTFGSWSAAQLYNSFYTNTAPTTTPHTLTFTPSGDAAVQINSFQFVTEELGEVGDTEVFDYTWTIIDANTSQQLDQGIVTEFGASDTPIDVNIGYTGGNGEPLTLELLRTTFSQDAQDGTPTGWAIAAQNFDFAEVPEPGILGFCALGFGLLLVIRWRRFAH